MKNTILKKIKSPKSKNDINDKNTNKNIESNNINNSNKIKDNDENFKYNSNNDILIDNDYSSSDTEDNFLTIEKAKNDNYNRNMDKIRALSNIFNNSNKINRNKKAYIFIKNDKSFDKNKNISPKIKQKEFLININNTDGCANTYNLNEKSKKIIKKEINNNLINSNIINKRNEKQNSKTHQKL